GDEQVTKQLYSEAISNYQAALVIKPGDKGATAKLTNAKGLLDKLNADKAKQEAEFNRLLTAGDEQVTNQFYSEAISNYQSALVIKPGDKGATAKLANAKGLLDKINADKAKQEAEFIRLVSMGDEQVVKQMYTEAIQTFRSALGLKPGNEQVRSKLDHAQNLFDKWQADQRKVMEEKTRQAEKRRRFDELIKQADQLFTDGSMRDSRKLYVQSLQIFESELHPKESITRIDTLLAQQERVRLLALQKSDEEKKLRDAGSYQLNIGMADKQLSQSNWTVAVYYYQEALRYKDGDKYATEKILSCNKMIEGSVTAEKMKEYEDNLKQGDKELKDKNYSSARFHFGRAYAIMPWEEYPKNQLKSIEKLLSSTNWEGKDAAYGEAIKKAEEAIAKKNFAVARFYFQSAITLRPEEAYPRQQLKRLSEEK
ncbi:MAG: hypothetical protein LWW85_15325, partial [Marinilabiliales bacterium]|nr:hypothetical protein [Marinilabiliales bacterium]